jgi:hypothetical protein
MSDASRIALLSGLVAASILLGVWGGEDVSVIFIDEVVFLAGLALAAVSILLVKGRWARALSPLGLFAVLAISVWLARRSAGKVFQRCSAEAAPLHARLKKSAHQGKPLPSSLSELGLNPPCELWLRATMLQYEKTDTGFRLSYSGWLTSHTATESTSGFKVTK